MIIDTQANDVTEADVGRWSLRRAFHRIWNKTGRGSLQANWSTLLSDLFFSAISRLFYLLDLWPLLHVRREILFDTVWAMTSLLTAHFKFNISETFCNVSLIANYLNNTLRTPVARCRCLLFISTADRKSLKSNVMCTSRRWTRNSSSGQCSSPWSPFTG